MSGVMQKEKVSEIPWVPIDMSNVGQLLSTSDKISLSRDILIQNGKIIDI